MNKSLLSFNPQPVLMRLTALTFPLLSNDKIKSCIVSATPCLSPSTLEWSAFFFGCYDEQNDEESLSLSQDTEVCPSSIPTPHSPEELGQRPLLHKDRGWGKTPSNIPPFSCLQFGPTLAKQSSPCAAGSEVHLVMHELAHALCFWSLN